MDLLLRAGDAAVWGVVLAAVAVVLAVITATTATRPRAGVPDLDGYLWRWGEVHDSYDPRRGSIWVRGWLIMIYRFARPLAGVGVAPDVLTLWTVWLALAVIVAATAGGAWLALAGWLVLAGGIVDSLDGAVAVLTDRATRWGYVLDSAVDRLNDVLVAVALVVVGAPVWLAVVYALLLFELEYIRARAGNAGGDPIGAITVGERANRVAFGGAGLVVAGLLPERAHTVAAATVAVLALLSVVGLGQLVVAVRRDLGGSSGGADEVGDDARGEGHQGHAASGM